MPLWIAEAYYEFTQPVNEGFKWAWTGEIEPSRLKVDAEGQLGPCECRGAAGVGVEVRVERRNWPSIKMASMEIGSENDSKPSAHVKKPAPRWRCERA